MGPQDVIKALILVPSVIFFFYALVYAILFELKVQPQMSKVYRNLSIVLAGGGAILLVAFIII